MLLIAKYTRDTLSESAMIVFFSGQQTPSKMTSLPLPVTFETSYCPVVTSLLLHSIFFILHYYIVFSLTIKIEYIYIYYSVYFILSYMLQQDKQREAEFDGKR